MNDIKKNEFTLEIISIIIFILLTNLICVYIFHVNKNNIVFILSYRSYYALFSLHSVFNLSQNFTTLRKET